MNDTCSISVVGIRGLPVVGVRQATIATGREPDRTGRHNMSVGTVEPLSWAAGCIVDVGQTTNSIILGKTIR